MTFLDEIVIELSFGDHLLGACEAIRKVNPKFKGPFADVAGK